MKAHGPASHSYVSQQTQPGSPARPANDSTSFDALLDAKTASADSGAARIGSRVDFTSMTRQEMADWVNNEIRSGRMTIDESSPFVGMTVKVNIKTGKPVDMATDATRINFIEKVRSGIEFARSRNDEHWVERLQRVLEIMHENKGKPMGVDVRA